MKRDLKLLDPELLVKFAEWAVRMSQAGIPFIVVGTGRTMEEQECLYAQGRKPLDEVNALRKRLNWRPLAEKDNKKAVTWTLDSKHLMRGEGSRAFDFAVLNAKGQPTWAKASHPAYELAGELAEDLGLVWLGRFNKDLGHIQLA